MHFREEARWVVDLRGGDGGDDDCCVVPGDGGIVGGEEDHAVLATEGVFAGTDEAIDLLFLIGGIITIIVTI